ncbi:hypothetical protein [Streptomyces sp. YKOK-I1]
MNPASPSDWAAAGSLGLTAIALVKFGLAFADADLAYFDPRPALGRAVDRLLIEAVRARHSLHTIARQALLTAAALLALITPENAR